MTSGITLTPYQQHIHDFLVRTPCAAAWLPVGGGKTLATLSMLQTVRPAGHILVIAPVAIARSTWLDEIDKWKFPIRTKSLIATENDKPLSKAQRLKRFQEVLTDPPTMYFINRELLTQSSHSVTLLRPSPEGLTTAMKNELSTVARELWSILSQHPGISQEDLVQFYQHHQSQHGSPGVSVSQISAQVSALVRCGAVTRQREQCPTCQGKGCTACSCGLINQLPRSHDGTGRIIWPFPTVIIDEAQGFKSHTSQRFRALKKVRPAITRLVELTGTPAPNGLHDIWSQMYLLDQGASLGRTVTEFRRRWFVPQMIPGTQTPARWNPVAGADQEIYAAINHLVLSARNTQAHLPGMSVHDVTVRLPPGLMDDYRSFKEDMILDVVSQYVNDHGELIQDIDQIIVDNAAVLTNKLLQFASGTVYTTIDDDGQGRGHYTVIHDKKLEMVEYLIRNNGNEPVILAYHFRSDLQEMQRRFATAGIDARLFDGSREMVRRWNNREIPVLLLHPASAGHGLNLQHGGSTLIWYTLPFSLEHYMQTNGRVYRTGQTQPVTIYRLLTAGTHDMRMPSLLEMKEGTQDDLVRAVSHDRSVAASRKTMLADAVRSELTTELSHHLSRWVRGT